MSNFRNIQNKLEQFIRKYYMNELLKGAILFFATGLLYFIFTLLVEYILWLDPLARTILFWAFVLVEAALFVRFIALPMARLFKLQKGINYEDASKIIGQHFKEVNDKLLNVLQLQKDAEQSELLLASIDQKSAELNPIPFKLAINYRKNLPYLKYAAIPVVIILMVIVSGNFSWFSDSYDRVVHYKTAYEPPAPFQFFVLNDSLDAIENKDFKLIVKTAGDVLPENASITYNDETYFLQQKGVGAFEYVFSQPKRDIQFRLSSNEVISKPYMLQVVEVPTLLSFEMLLDFPGYTKKRDVTLKSTGNATVPEGTRVSWKLKTKSTDQVQLFAKDTLSFSSDESGVFGTSKRVRSNLDYSISTSNAELINYENLRFKIEVIKDEYPVIDVQMQKDSLDLQTLYFYGQVNDDYGFNKLQLVYYKVGDEENKNYKGIELTKSNISEFISAFPDDLDIDEGEPYELFFQVFDNDEVNSYKSAKSGIFSYRKRTLEEEEEKVLKEQSETIEDLNKSLEKFEEQNKSLEELSRMQKEKPILSFNDRKKLESFLKRQKQQDEMMKNFNKKLRENIEHFERENKEQDAFKEDLEKRLEEQEKLLERDEKLLEELKKLQDQINKEELTQKLDELAKQNKNKKRSLQQLLELTKRFYVEKKLEKLANDLSKLAEEQEKLSDEPKEKNTSDKQEELNERFDSFKKDLEELKKEGKALKKPIEVPQDKLEENEIQQEQEKATERLKELEKNEGEQNSEENEQPQNEEQNQEGKDENQKLNGARKSQKNAGKKMKQMSQNMQQARQGSGGDQMQEDMDMLRQILDNLVLFSFDQEALMERFKGIEVDNNRYASYLRKQNTLKEHFEHVDDSLFALSLRNPKISEDINKEITEVYYNIDKALAQFAENQLYQGVSNQQFAITAANNLANMLSDVLDNMQENLSMSPSKGGQGEMQLPDIIMSQEELNKMMQDGMKKKGDRNQKGDEDEQEGDQKGDKQDKGKSGENRNGEGNHEGENGLDEQMNGELFKIYQQQQELRRALEKQLEDKKGIGRAGDRLLKQMEDVELELLNKGFTNQTLQKMMALKHQLLKLENASFQQGKDNKRESESNTKEFKNTTGSSIPKAKQYFNTTEILNRQALPLQQTYKKKVQEYFKKKDD